jgi:hypothetical protein
LADGEAAFAFIERPLELLRAIGEPNELETDPRA